MYSLDSDCTMKSATTQYPVFIQTLAPELEL